MAGRMRKLKACVPALLLTLLAGAAAGGYLESDYGAQQPPERPRQPRIIPPRPEPDPVVRFVRRCRVGQGTSYGGLTVFPVLLHHVEDTTNYLSLEEALASGGLTVREEQHANVPGIVVVNRGPKYVFLLTGEILLGGKQNRGLQQDVLLAPHSGPVKIPVYCFEQGRWSGAGGAFKHSSSVGNPALRAGAAAGASQEAVWKEVDGQIARLNQKSENRNLHVISSDKEVKGKLSEYRRRFTDCFPEPVVGMIVFRWGRPVGADLFCNAGLFRKQWPKLLDSYAIDCIGVTRKALPRPQDRRQAESFLHRVYSARIDYRSSPGAGRQVRLYARSLTGQGLVHNSGVVHVAIFDRTLMPMPHPEPLRDR